jgi:hypothetical protein
MARVDKQIHFQIWLIILCCISNVLCLFVFLEPLIFFNCFFFFKRCHILFISAYTTLVDGEIRHVTVYQANAKFCREHNYLKWKEPENLTLKKWNILVPLQIICLLFIARYLSHKLFHKITKNVTYFYTRFEIMTFYFIKVWFPLYFFKYVNFKIIFFELQVDTKNETMAAYNW